MRPCKHCRGTGLVETEADRWKRLKTERLAKGLCTNCGKNPIAKTAFGKKSASRCGPCLARNAWHQQLHQRRQQSPYIETLRRGRFA
jgi:ribosomal protein L37AE/L43A